MSMMCHTALRFLPLTLMTTRQTAQDRRHHQRLRLLFFSSYKQQICLLAPTGSVISPWLAKPNSSRDILRSSPMTVVPRYSSGTSKRLPSAVYMTQWPLAGAEVQHPWSSLAVTVMLLSWAVGWIYRRDDGKGIIVPAQDRAM
ncbi:uncharacterized protein [Aegilops tauschii subsp. strangulata]|uniref:uncharacterized protein n=1 Tax=Aegilops tauschii subsp. strangulata TaxID=200361 RepID=UPI000844F628